MSLLGQTRDLARAAEAAYRDAPLSPVVARIAPRLDEPLRVAIAGRVKAGKSTLLNGLIGQELAATDAGECTRIVTWFQDGGSYRVTLHPREGPPRQLPWGGAGSLAQVDLHGYSPDEVDRLVVDWPSRQLRAMTLIDTPGMGSVDTVLSRRAGQLLAPEGPNGSDADAVIYLMRHLHSDDVGFLESIHDNPGQGHPINTVGVLARADEVGHSRADALDSAARIATRYQADPRVRRLCHSVIPVAGLLASCAASLREAEFLSLRLLSNLPEEDRRRLLLSTDRFVSLDTRGTVDPGTRIELLTHVGLYGVRRAIELITRGEVHTATELSATLSRLSGIAHLRELLATQFAARAEVLKARTALLALASVFAQSPPPVALARRLEEVRAGAHEFTEIRLVDGLREDPTLLAPEDLVHAERLLGVHGVDHRGRLGLAPDAREAEVLDAAFSALARWQRMAEDPIAGREAKAAARILVRTCEGIVTDRATGRPGP